MRRAAALAIALVAGLLLLLSRQADPERTVRRSALAPEEPAVAASSAREASEPEERGEAGASDPSTLADGVVTDAEGNPVPGQMLFAIPRDEERLWDMEEPELPRADAPDLPQTATDARGAFAFRGLARGEYRLALGEGWTPETQVVFREDTKRLRVVADRAWTAHLVFLDLATSEPIPRLRVRYRWPPDAADERVADGSDGVFRARLRGSHGDLVVRAEAEGYHRSTAYGWAGQEQRSRNFWMARDVEPRLVLRIQFKDGAPCEEEASVFAQHLGEPRNAFLPAARDGGGRYRVALPPGSWRIEFRPEHSQFFREECEAEVHVLAGERLETFLNLERGGEIVVRRKGWDGTRWSLRVASVPWGATESIPVSAASYEMRHVQPGKYFLGARAATGGGETGWRREVEVTTGSRHELTIE